MGKAGRYYHGSTVTEDVAAIGTSYDKDKYHTHVLTPGQFTSIINGVYVRIKTIAGGSATPKITMRLSCDSGGDYTFLPDTEATVAIGLSTSTVGVCAWQFDLPVKQFFGTGTVYLHIKIDQGTCTLDASCITWSE